jgi:hypothetical protein
VKETALGTIQFLFSFCLVFVVVFPDRHGCSERNQTLWPASEKKKYPKENHESNQWLSMATTSHNYEKEERREREKSKKLTRKVVRKSEPEKSRYLCHYNHNNSL